jgi:hypothetical protein
MKRGTILIACPSANRYRIMKAIPQMMNFFWKNVFTTSENRANPSRRELTSLAAPPDGRNLK